MTAWKPKVAERRKSVGSGNTKKLAGSLALSKSFKSAITTHVKLSDEEANFIMDKIGKEDEENEVKA